MLDFVDSIHAAIVSWLMPARRSDPPSSLLSAKDGQQAILSR